MIFPSAMGFYIVIMLIKLSLHQRKLSIQIKQRLYYSHSIKYSSRTFAHQLKQTHTHTLKLWWHDADDDYNGDNKQKLCENNESCNNKIKRIIPIQFPFYKWFNHFTWNCQLHVCTVCVCERVVTLTSVETCSYIILVCVRCTFDKRWRKMMKKK